MPRADFVCAPRLRVRWAEVDMQKIVFNGHYLTYIDTAIAEYWREIGLPYPHGYVERYASDVFLRKATVEYLGSARYDDVLAVCCRVAKLGRSSLTFHFEIYREAEQAALVTAELVYVDGAAPARSEHPRGRRAGEAPLGGSQAEGRAAAQHARQEHVAAPAMSLQVDFNQNVHVLRTNEELETVLLSGKSVMVLDILFAT